MDLKELARHETVMDDVSRRVARVYAESLYEAATQKQQEKEMLDELTALQAVLVNDPHLKAALTGAGLGRDRRHTLLRAFDGRAGELLVNFLNDLNDHDRLDALPAVIIGYQDLFDQRHNRMRVAVRSAVELDNGQLDNLRKQLHLAFGKDALLQTAVDPELLGGLVVEVEGWLYDSSIRSRLMSLRKEISEKGSYEIQSGRDRFSSATGN